jgi:hypothetical protein
MAEAVKPAQTYKAVAGATVALVLLTALNFVNYTDRYILPGVQELVKKEFHVTAPSPSGSSSPTCSPRRLRAGWETTSRASR